MSPWHVKIKVRQYKDKRFGFDDYSLGARHKVRLRTKQKAIQRATILEVFLENGRKELLSIDPAELAEFRRWKRSSESSPPIKDAIDRLLKLKSPTSSKNLKSLTGHLRIFEKFIGEKTPIGTIKAERIQEFLDERDGAQRTKSNYRASLVTLFRWARKMSYVEDKTTEAENVSSISRIPGQVNVLSPDEMRILLDHVRDEFLPWLLVAAFAGIRSEEIAPDANSKKSPLLWEDFDWKHRVIIVRAETAKTKAKRRVPILPNLSAWLERWRGASGRICEAEPSKGETARLGKFIDGWKHNAPRDSFCSYRAAITQNLEQVSYEMGNTIEMVKRSYHENQPIRIAKEWFNIRPAKSTNVLAFPKKVPKSSNSVTSKGRIWASR